MVCVVLAVGWFEIGVLYVWGQGSDALMTKTTRVRAHIHTHTHTHTLTHTHTYTHTHTHTYTHTRCMQQVLWDDLLF